MKTFFTLVLIFTLTISSFAQLSSLSLKSGNTKSSSLKSDKLSLFNNSDIAAKKKRDYTFSANLYVWALSLDGSVALPVENPNVPLTQTPVLDVKLKFSDALKYLKFAFMFSGSLTYKNSSLLYDIVYAKLKFDGTVPLQSGYIYGVITSEQFLGDFALGYVFPLKNKKVRLTGYAGTRISSLNNKMDLYYVNYNFFETEKSKTWVDPIIGASTRFDIAKRWLVYIRSDIGGFGVSSKFTVTALGSIGYKFTPQWNTTLGFKYLYTDYDKDNYLWKTSSYGLLLSLGYTLM